MQRIQVIHQTDIYVPPADPDDHYDLACQFALADMGLIDLGDVLIDWPPPLEWQTASGIRGGAPAVDSVAQLSLLSGVWPRVTIGAPRGPAASGAVAGQTLLAALDRADMPVDIHIVGSCSDVAAAAALDAELFAAKCRRVYVNAGSSLPAADAVPEWNTALDPAAYAAMFSLPCPTYWMPCFQARELEDEVVEEYSTHWVFDQGPLLDKLPSRLRQYFVWALDQPADVNWFSVLDSEHTLSPERYAERRHMWCIAGFLHSVGLTVLADGTIADASAAEEGVFEFVPVDWSCDEQGQATWSRTTSGDGKYVFRVSNQTAYESAMTTALIHLLRRLGADASPA